MIFEKYLLELLSTPDSRTKPQVRIDLLYFIKSKCCFYDLNSFFLTESEIGCKGRHLDSTSESSQAAGHDLSLFPS